MSNSTDGTTVSSTIYPGTVIASGVFVGECVVIVGLVIGIVILLCYRHHRKTHKPDTGASTLELVSDPDLVVDTMGRDNLGYGDVEGGGEEDNPAFDVTKLRIPTEPVNEHIYKSGDLDGPDVVSNLTVKHSQSDERDNRRNQYHETHPKTEQRIDLSVYIKEWVKDTDENPEAPPFDIPVIYHEEGGPWESVSLSSNSDMSNLSEDLQFDYLNDWGPKFGKLSHLYADEED